MWATVGRAPIAVYQTRPGAGFNVPTPGTLKEGEMDTLAKLKKYNGWRRGLDTWHDDASTPNPVEIGEIIDDACNELERLRRIEQAAELAYGALWMTMHLKKKQQTAKDALAEALSNNGRERGIQSAIDHGLQADHPSQADYWSGKQEGA